MENLFKLDERYYIGQDNYNIILIEYKKNINEETGQENEIFKKIGYYSNLENCLNKYLQLILLDNMKNKNLEELLFKLNEIKKDFKNINNNIMTKYQKQKIIEENEIMKNFILSNKENLEKYEEIKNIIEN